MPKTTLKDHVAITKTMRAETSSLPSAVKALREWLTDTGYEEDAFVPGPPKVRALPSIAMWAPCTPDAEDVLCPCGNNVMSSGFQAVGTIDHIAHNTSAPLGEVEPRLWGIIECQDCGTVIDNNIKMEPQFSGAPLRPLPWMRVWQTDEYTHRLGILWMPHHVKVRVAGSFRSDPRPQ